MAGLTRRRFNTGILGAAGALATGALATGGAPFAPARADAPRRLTAMPGRAQLTPPDQPMTDIWGFDGVTPGPEIRARQGERVTRLFENRLPQASSVHWHGVRIDNRMDGAPGLTQAAVEPGASFLYDFAVPDAGTYWYHPHSRTWEQMARGLYGALIVEEPDGAPAVDLDQALLIDDWRLSDDAQIAGGFGAMHDRAHAGRLGNWITVNGDGAWSRAVGRSARLRLRLVNTANARIFTLALSGLEGWVVALDGMPLAAPEPFRPLRLAPAQRADLIVDVTADAGSEAFLVSRERGGDFALAAFPVSGSAQPKRRPPPAALPANPVPPLGDLASARRATLLMEGGARGGLRGARLGERMRPLQELVRAGKAWALNGAADRPATPLLTADRGETLRILLQNDTFWEHAMHLHGHHFRVIAEDGTVGPLRDTVLTPRGQRVEIAFVADNPGDWLLHCHMLEHAAAGMSTWIRVL